MKMPVVLNIDGPVIIFGGGNIGQRKVEYASKFTDDITVISKETLPMPDHVRIKVAEVDDTNISEHIPDNTALVISALPDRELNKAIAKECLGRGILINVVDDQELSNIFFSAISKAGDVTISISTSGRSPFLARKLREEMDDWIIGKDMWLEILSPFRSRISGIDEKNRIFEAMFADSQLKELVESGKVEEAEKRAKEVFDVHCQH